jgi:hypothetical protein
MNQKIPLIATTVAILFMIALVPTLPAFASNSTDEGSGNAGSDVSCSPITGNPLQEKCDEKPTLRTGYAKRLD